MLAALCSKCGKRGQQNNFDEEAEVIHGRYSSGLATPLNITGNSVLQFMYLSVKQKSLFKILSDKGEKQSRTFVFHIKLEILAQTPLISDVDQGISKLLLV